MKRILPIIMLSALLPGCKKESSITIEEKPIFRSVEFQVARLKDYSETIYDGVQVEVKLALSKESKSTGTNQIIWDTTFTLRHIRQYPSPNNELHIIKQSGNFLESKESLRVSESIRYLDGTTTSFTASGEVIQGNTVNTIVPVKL